MRHRCRPCARYYGDLQSALCPHAYMPSMPSLEAAGTARPSSPVPVFAEDFSLLIRRPRRLRIARGRIHVLS